MSGRARPRRFARHGFTFVEVLATLVVLGIVLPVAMRGITVALRLTAHARLSAEAAQLADLKLNELLALRDVPSFNAAGDFGDDRPEFRWESRGQVADGGVYAVTVSVYWAERGEERAMPLTTWVYVAPATTTTTTTGGEP